MRAWGDTSWSGGKAIKRPILLLTLTAALWSKALGSLLILTGWWLLKTF